MRNGIHACKICDWMRVSEKKSKIIKFLLKMRKCFVAKQPVLLVGCSTKFFLFKNVCLLENFLFFYNGKLTFRKHCKIAIGIKACNFQFCFRFVWRNQPWTPESSHMTCCSSVLYVVVTATQTAEKVQFVKLGFQVAIIWEQNASCDGGSSFWWWRSN